MLQYQKEAKEKYNPDDIFKNSKPNVGVEESGVSIIEYKESVLKKIMNWLKKIFIKN